MNEIAVRNQIKLKHEIFAVRKKECLAYFRNLIFNELPCKAWIAGGALRDFFSSREIETKDYDMFFSSEADFEKARKWFLSHEGKIIQGKNLTTVQIDFRGKRFELVKTFFGSPGECIDAFDFTIVCCAVDKKHITHVDDFWKDLSERKLVIHNPYFLYSTMYRIKKHRGKGFKIDDYELGVMQERLKVIAAFMKSNYFKAKLRSGIPRTHLLVRIIKRFAADCEDFYQPKDCDVIFYGDDGVPKKEKAFSNWIYDKYSPLFKEEFLAELL